MAWLKTVGYIALGAISSSLVGYGIHWWSDYPLALALGYSFGEIAANPLGVTLREKHDGADTRLSFSPVAFSRGAGVGMSLSF